MARGLCRIGNGLHRRRVERQQHHLDAVPVHLGDAPLLDVHDPVLDFLPDALGESSRGNPPAFRE